MTSRWSSQEIEESRARQGVDPGWEWSLCQGGCGDLVWHPPMKSLREASAGRSIVLVCSGECGKRWMQARRADG